MPEREGPPYDPEMKPPYLALTYKCNKSCDFCFNKGLGNRFSRDMELSDFEKVVKWLSAQGIDMVGLLGGEPTLYPKLAEALDICQRNKVCAVFCTNGLFKDMPDIFFDDSVVTEISVHILSMEKYEKGEWKMLQSNLKRISKMKILLLMKSTILSPSDSFSHLFDAAKKYRASEITIGPAVPGSMGENSFVKKEKFSELKGKLIDMCREGARKEVKCSLGAPLPLCIFTAGERNYLKRFDLHAVCNRENFVPPVIIRPDLSFQACGMLPLEKKDICSFNSMKDARFHFKKEFDKIKWKPFYPECVSCIYHLRRQCQGACLSYKL
jgi:MoaA/NifB/PqqE/SkfB family radical SAM enzyme